MRRLGILFIFLALTLFVGTSPASLTASSFVPTQIAWQHYSDSPFNQAKKSNHLILLYGRSKTCHWCQEMDKNVWQNPAIIQTVQANYIPVIVDVDTQFDLVTKYRMLSLPTLIILDANNRIVKLFSGYFTPDVIEKSLDDIIKNNITADSSTTVSNTPTISLLSKADDEKLKQQQLHFYSQPLPKNRFDLNEIDYASLIAPQHSKLISNWIEQLLRELSNNSDPIWGGIYSPPENGLLHFEKDLQTQGECLQFLSQLNIYWKNTSEVLIAKKIIDYASHFLTSPEGVFYNGQEAFSSKEKDNIAYYKLDSSDRLQTGIPPSDTHIYAGSNAAMISGLTEFYMVTGDVTALNQAEKAMQWLITNLSMMDGGFRHEKNASDAIYLKDTLATGNALLTLYKATANPFYLNRAIEAANFINLYLKNPNGHAGFISAQYSQNPTGSFELKAAENAEMIHFTTLLYHYTGEKFLKEMSLNAFQYLMTPEVMNNHSPALILLAENKMTTTPIHIVIIGSKTDPDAKKLYQAALANTPFFSRIDWWDRKENPLRNSDTTYPVLNKSAAYICYAFHCSFPIYDVNDLATRIHEIIFPTKTAINSPKMITKNDSNHFSFRNFNGAEDLLVKNNIGLMIIGFLIFGLLLSFTPCILPLIPIMASIIVGHTIGVKKHKTFLLCLIYVISMSVTYSILGVLAGQFGLYLQVYMQQTWIIVLFSLIFLLLGLSMLDAYEIKLPRVFLDKVSRLSNLQEGGNVLGVMIMGALSTLIVSPCVSAPLAGALSFITKTGNYMLGAIGLFFMGLGMGIPLLILSVFSKNILPKVSRWNKKIKIAFGIISLGLSIWIISRILSDSIGMALWSALIIFIAINMDVFKRKTKTLFNKFWKTLAIMVLTCGIALLFDSLFINSDIYRSFLYSEKNLSPKATFNLIKNEDELNHFLKMAKQNQLPVMLDFSAKWCSACVNIDNHVFTDASLTPVLNKFVLLRADLTDLNSESMTLARQFIVSGPPAILFFDKEGQLLDFRVTGDTDANELLQKLQQTLEMR